MFAVPCYLFSLLLWLRKRGHGDAPFQAARPVHVTARSQQKRLVRDREFSSQAKSVCHFFVVTEKNSLIAAGKHVL